MTRSRLQTTATVTAAAAVVAGLTVTGVELAGGSGGHRAARAAAPSPSISPVDMTGTVAWVDQPGTWFVPSPYPTTAPKTDAPGCRTRDLRLKAGGRNGAGGTTYLVFAFRNDGAAACILRGAPRVTASEPGQPTLTAKNTDGFDTTVPANMDPGETTEVTIETATACNGGIDIKTYHHLRFELPDGDSLGWDGEVLGPDCYFATTPFGVRQPDPRYTKSPVAGATVALELPSGATAGESMQYVADVTNPTDHVMTLSPCPAYLQGIGTGKGDPLALNCDAVDHIDAGQTIRFAMRLDVPASTPTGPATVFWTLGDSDPESSFANGTVNVYGGDNPCGTDELKLSVAPGGTSPAPGAPEFLKFPPSAATATVTNTSSATCSIGGPAHVAVIPADGSGPSPDYQDGKRFGLIADPASIVELKPGESATATLYWFGSWCAADPDPVDVVLILRVQSVKLSATSGWPPPSCRKDGEPDQTSTTVTATQWRAVTG